MLLPFPILLQSRIQTRKKVILLGLFGLGTFITVIQIVRIQTVKKLSNYIDSAPLILWSTVENNLGILCANVPTLAPLVKYYNERTSRSGGAAGSRTPGAYIHRTAGAYGVGSRRSAAVGGGRSIAGGGAGAAATTKSGGARVSSWYGSGTWRSGRPRGAETLASHATELASIGGTTTRAGSLDDDDGGGGGLVVSAAKKNGSMDSILQDIASVSGVSGGGGGGGGGGGSMDDKDAEEAGDRREECLTSGGITKKVEVVITRT
ncbi:hypothetical protein VTG60DRAFT_5904 [Thermothelomyces hinnuleus]